MKNFIFNEFTFKLGNNANENNQLLNIASQNDIWFHLNDHPSPHGILFTNNQIPNKNTIISCASEIKKYSKLKSQKNTKIIFTKRKYIKKTSTPGSVIISKKNYIII